MNNNWIAVQTTTESINMFHQKYIAKQMNVCRGYSGSRESKNMYTSKQNAPEQNQTTLYYYIAN